MTFEGPLQTKLFCDSVIDVQSPPGTRGGRWSLPSAVQLCALHGDSPQQQEQGNELVQGNVLLRWNSHKPQHGLLALVSALCPVVQAQPWEQPHSTAAGGLLSRVSGAVLPWALRCTLLLAVSWLSPLFVQGECERSVPKITRAAALQGRLYPAVASKWLGKCHWCHTKQHRKLCSGGTTICLVARDFHEMSTLPLYHCKSPPIWLKYPWGCRFALRTSTHTLSLKLDRPGCDAFHHLGKQHNTVLLYWKVTEGFCRL